MTKITTVYDRMGKIVNILEGYEQLNIIETKQIDDNKIIIKVDVSSIPHKLIIDDIRTKPTYKDLENKVLLLENEKIEGGIF
ncbi:hypothetical protein AN1V17_47430 [Vallitalea sediminicola]